ncbi:amino acid adenylation domain-containing protein [Sorangium sp. So ce136]|uniref:amino acid adenylation domain-containing protein n=1 Tax=Sorangium sp. So ce136 TaxID=3133284 RepID=UPI003F107346
MIVGMSFARHAPSSAQDHSFESRSAVASLPELLARRAKELGDAPAYIHLQEGEEETAALSFAALHARARTIAAFLRKHYPPRSRVLLLFGPGLDFIEAFFGCLLADMVGVPTSLPRPNQAESRFDAITADCAPACALTARPMPRERSASTSRSGLTIHTLPIHTLEECCSVTDAERADAGRTDGAADVAGAPDDVAYLQYTSGSTSSPKGVMVSHRNVLQNCRMLADGFGMEGGDTFVSWLPHFHDLGLIHGIMLPLFVGGRCYSMPPASFIFRPMRWLEALSRHRGHHGAAPNFAFDLCVTSSTAEQRARLDLSAWKTVINGAEPVRAGTLARFLAAFAPSGFRPDALRPSYGLAEATLGVSVSPRRPPRVVKVSSTELQEGRVRACSAADTDAQELVSCGRPLADTRVAIVDPASGEPAPDRRVGEVWVDSSAVVSGYWQNPEATRASFGARLRGAGDLRFLRTGDLGFLHEGELFITGRLKDVIIVRGRNYYPQDIELAVCSAHEAFAPDGGAAFSVGLEDGLSLPVEDPEAIVVCQEIKRGQRGLDLEALARAARRAVAQQFGLPVHAVVLLPPRRLPKTTSGKAQRRACKAAFLRGELEALGVFHGAPTRDGAPGAAAALDGADGADGAAAAACAQPDDSGCTARLGALVGELLQIDAAQLRWDVPLVEVGLESIKAIQLAERIARLSGRQISPVSLIEGMTLTELLRLIAEPLPSGGREGEPPVVSPGDDDPEAPFAPTDVQRAYLVGRESAFDLGGVGCHGYLERECDGLDLERFERAWNRVIARHGMLRSVFTEDGLQRAQRTVPRFEPKVWDLRAMAPADACRALDDIRHRLSHRVFTPTEWPLFDVGVSLLPGGRRRVHINLDLLALDAWSCGIVSRDLERFYEQPEIELPPLGVTFRDCIVDAERHRRTPDHERSLSYWRERVASLPPAPDLPLARKPRDVTPPRFARHKGRLDRSAWESLKSRAKSSRLTPSAVVLAAFAQVLGKWSARPEFSLTLTSFERPPLHEDVSEIVGDFTTVVLLGFDVGRHRGVSELARATQDQIWRAIEHRRAGVIPALRQMHAPSVPVVFTSLLGQGGAEPQSLFSWLGEEVFMVTQTPQVWLDHQVTEDQGDLAFSWDVVEGLFPEGMVGAMLESYLDLLARLARGDEGFQRARVALPSSQQAARAEVNRTQRAAPDELLHAAFLRSAAARGESPAVIAPEGSITYGELDRRSNALGRALRARGARPNTLIAIACEKGIPQALGTLGILKSGAAYVPVDPTWPRERIWGILEQGAAQIVLTQARFAEPARWPAGMIVVPLDAPGGLSEDGSPLEAVQRPDDLAYVIFTSGSTGRPKGVAIDHLGAVNTIADVNARLGVNASDRVLSLSSLAFDLSVYDLFGLWAAGGAVVLPEPARLRDPGHWEELMSRHGVTLWNTVPALMQMLVEHRAPRSGPLAPLRAVLLSGDWIPVNLPDRIRETFPGASVLSLGGATEASIWSIAYPITHVEPSWKSIPYGKPLANQRFYVLDRAMEPCPDGVSGRLYIGGMGLARGYWRDEERTRERFVTHPETGERLYWTGDLGRWLPDGNIEFLGREDFQVKVQGHRIELEEIEAALLQHPDVASAAVSVGSTASGGKRLIAHVVPAPGRAPETAALRAFIASKLPDYMVPSAFVELPRLPLTSNGKVDRSALRDPAREPGVEAPLGEPPPVIAADPAPAPGLEALLREHPSVEAARVERAAGERAGLVAYVTTREGAADSTVSLLQDPIARLKYKLSKPAQRHDLAGAAIPLIARARTDEELSAFARRRSYREFRSEPIAFERLARFLRQLAPVRLPGYPLAKQLYSSAGNLYPVHAYLYVKPDRIERVPGGTYYFHPEREQLVAIQPGAHIDRSVHGGPNGQAFDSSAFSVYLVADLGAIEPVYGSRARDLCLMEAGVLAHLLESTAPDHEIGLCQTGGFDFAQVAHLFQVGPRYEYLHGLVGGAISASDTTVEALARESAALGAMVDAATRAASSQGSAPARPERLRDRLARALSSYIAERWTEQPVTVVVVDRLPGPAEGARLSVPEDVPPRAEQGVPPRAEQDAPPRAEQDAPPRAEQDAPPRAEQARTRPAAMAGDGLEMAIARIWAEVLRRPHVGHDVNFFDLGGDSLLLVSMSRGLRERFNCDVPLVHLFEHPTVSQQAAYLRTLGVNAPPSAKGEDAAEGEAAPGAAEGVRFDAIAARARRQRERGPERRALASFASFAPEQQASRRDKPED